MFVQIKNLGFSVYNSLDLLWLLLYGSPPHVHDKPSKGTVAVGSSSGVASESKIGTITQPSEEITVQNKLPPLFALIIGINQYHSPTIPTLKGAVNDASAIKSYLEGKLGVPSSQIKFLHDKEATREAITRELAALQTDDRIQSGDPIVIFYAGHGAKVPSPKGWEAGGPEVQVIVPYDCLKEVNSSIIQPIPDRTLGALLDKVAEKKGNNITVIFDCCHSGSGTRDHEFNFAATASPHPLVRGFELKVEIPTDLDSDKWDTDSGKRGTVIPNSFLQSNLRSHVLLAACSARETAKEEADKGNFTTALLEALQATGADKLTYTDLIQRLPILPQQNPQCEGYHQDRILFNSKAPSRNRPLYRVLMKSGQFILQAGAAHGITRGAIFSIYKDRDSSAAGSEAKSSIGSLTALDPDAFSTKMAVTSGTQEFETNEVAFALQTRAGEEEDLRIHIPFDEKLLGVFQAVAKEMQKSAVGQQQIVLVDKETAAFDVALEEEKVVFNIQNRLVTLHGLTQIPYRINSSGDDVYPIIRAMAHYHWHLNRTTSKGNLKNLVKVEFTKLSDSDEYDDFLNPIYCVDGPNLINDGVVDLTIDKQPVGDQTMYGMKLTNLSHVDLYAHVFFFDNSNLSITSYYEPGASAGRPDPSMLAKESITIGYGSGGTSPFSYIIGEGQDVDVGFVKVFLSTEYVDLSHVKQLSPFAPDGRESQAVKKKSPALWDTVLITVVQRKAK